MKHHIQLHTWLTLALVIVIAWQVVPYNNNKEMIILLRMENKMLQKRAILHILKEELLELTKENEHLQACNGITHDAIQNVDNLLELLNYKQ